MIALLKDFFRLIKRFFVNTKYKIVILFYFWKDYNYYINTNLLTAPQQKDTQAASIMLFMHQLEKGISMKKNPRIFGGDKAVLLTNQLVQYVSLYGVDHIVTIATNVLYEYFQDEYSTNDISQRVIIESFLKKHNDLIKEGYAGVKKISEPPHFDEKAIISFFESRSSVRDFSDELVTLDEINNAIKFAEVTPSACNRQSVRIHYYDDPSTMKELIDNQLGPQGWCHRAKGIAVVTSNQCFFGKAYERYESLIDGGLYAMNFVYGLHIQHIASCFKMFVREPYREKKFKEIGKIPYNEIPVVLILVGHYKQEEILEPKSVRYNKY